MLLCSREALLQGRRILEFKVRVSFHRRHSASIMVRRVKVKGEKSMVVLSDGDERQIRSLSEASDAILSSYYICTPVPIQL